MTDMTLWPSWPGSAPTSSFLPSFGGSRDAFIERRRRVFVPKKLPMRFAGDFGLPRGPTLDFIAPCQCFVGVRRFSSRRASDRKSTQKWTALATRLEPDRSTKRFERPDGAQETNERTNRRTNERPRGGRAQKTRNGSAVRAPDARGFWFFF